MMDNIREAAEILIDCTHVVVSTGAGVSRESGIPTFRETQTGIWANFDPEELATLDGFLRNPKLVWEWYQSRIEMIKQVEPNPGHYAIASMEDLFPEFILITQNIDNLHQKAGSKQVCELHGNILQYKCLEEETIIESWEKTDQVPPRCPNCNAFIRPNVVWFGESLPPNELSYAFEQAANCDAMIVVGTSGVVQPAASLPVVARRAGAKVIEVNPERSAISTIAEVFLQGKSGEVLPRLYEELQKLRLS